MTEPSPQTPPPAPRRGVLREILESLRELGSIGKPCTCGNPSKIGPCPRHGTLN